VVSGNICDGAGSCKVGTMKCTPYACAGMTCATSCKSDADCDAKFTCASGTCIPRTGAVCDGDHLLVAADGTKTDCAPYKCEGATCKAKCASIAECAYPNECAPETETCVAPLAGAPPSTSSGCSCRAAGDGTRGPWPVALSMAALFAHLMRRARRARCPTFGRTCAVPKSTTGTATPCFLQPRLLLGDGRRERARLEQRVDRIGDGAGAVPVDVVVPAEDRVGHRVGGVRGDEAAKPLGRELHDLGDRVLHREIQFFSFE
jgi:MYXO-CTERM domain-containing protein